VGHSIGGLVARVVAREFPADVAGLVLIDPTHEDTRLSYQGHLVRVRDDAKGRAVPKPATHLDRPPSATAAQLKEFAEFQHMLGRPRIEPPYDRLDSSSRALRMWAESDSVKRPAIVEDFWPEELQQLHDERLTNPRPLGEKPLVIIVAGRDEAPDPGMTAQQVAEMRALGAEKRTQKKDLTQLSANARFLIDSASGHNVQLDDPPLVIGAILDEIRAIRARRPASAARRPHHFRVAIAVRRASRQYRRRMVAQDSRPRMRWTGPSMPRVSTSRR
jgi:pimeloyl-ACP methyl ester carboxylesterase